MLDFAVHANDGYIRLRDVADRQGISKAYLEQIMVLLNKADLFATARGYQGGYQLAKSPSAYTLGDILRITEGSLAPVDAGDGSGNSGSGAGTGSDLRVGNMTDDVWQGLEQVVAAYLDNLTLQDLLDAHREDPGYDFCI
jgi:Rrf2 family protein